MKPLQNIKGMNDCLPEQTPLWQYLEQTLRELANSYGYREIRFPVLEQSALFKRAIGDATDIVEKEMYTFEDRAREGSKGDLLSLRPEGTAVCVRAGLQQGLLYNQQQRLWYMGPMFRRERPQKGRLRQFHQFGIESFGFDGPDMDAEQILLTARLWKLLGIDHQVTLELNSLGTKEERAEYRAALVEYLSQHKEHLDADSLRRLETNPLRVLDSKVESTKAIVANAPVLTEYLGTASSEHFEQLQHILTTAGVSFNINPHLVRGLDYYGLTVFEWVTDALGAQGTVCAGGRYDALVEQLGGKPTPATGFAMGLERLCLLLEANGVSKEQQADVYLICPNEQAVATCMAIAEDLRAHLPRASIVTHCGGGSLKSQLKKADKSGASFAVILGDEELASGMATLKPMRGGEQIQLSQAALAEELAQRLAAAQGSE